MDFSRMLDSAWNSETRHILVSGENGTGKTFFLLNMACELRKSTPIYIDLSAANGDSYISREILKEYCGHSEFQETDSLLNKKLIIVFSEPAYNEAKYVLLLDGIDEISPHYSGNLCKELEMLASCSGVQIVLAAKSKKYVQNNFYFEKLEFFSEYPLQPLSKETARQTLKKQNIDYDRLSDPIKKLLGKPLFVSAVIETAQNGTSPEKFNSAYDVYSAIVKHDIEVVAKRDGKLGVAEYALNKLLPALAVRLDSIAFSDNTLRKALMQAFLDTAYANPGLDGIPIDLLARIRQNNNPVERRMFEEIAKDGIINRYLYNVFIDRLYIVKIDENHYRFNHSSWLSFFQLKHIANEIGKTDNKSIPNSVSEEQAKRLFGNIKKAEERIAADGLDALAEEAFQNSFSVVEPEQEPEPGPIKKIYKSVVQLFSTHHGAEKKHIIISIIFVLLAITLVGLLAEEGIAKKPIYHFTLTPTEMTLKEYKEATETIRERTKILADGKRYKFKSDGDKIDISLPQSVFYGADPMKTMKNYVSREGLVYLIDMSSLNGITLECDNIQLRQQDIEKVTTDFGVIPEIGYDFNPDGYHYITIQMTPGWSEKNRDKLAAWKTPRIACNIGYDSWNYAESTILSGDFQFIFVPFTDSIPKNFIDVLAYNISHYPLAGGFYIDFEAKPVWENVKDVAHPGALKRNESKLKKNTVTLYYDTPIEDINTGSWIDLLAVLRARMDAIGEPYALGYNLNGNSYQVLIKTLPNHLNTEIIHLLTMKYPNIAFSVVGGLHRYDEKDCYRLIANPIEMENGSIYLGISSTLWSDDKSLEEFVAECKADGISELLFCINDIPVLCTTVDSITSEGELLFQNIYLNGEILTEKTKWLVDFIKEMMEGPDLPCSITYFGAAKNAPENVRIEDFFEVNSYARLSQIEDSIKSVDPYLTTTGVSASEATYYLVFLHLPVNEELPEKAVEEIEEMYNAVDFTNFGFRNIMFTLGEENDKEKERARFIFEKDYSEKDVDLVIIFKNGRYEKYRDQLDDIIQQDSFFEQFDITWN